MNTATLDASIALAWLLEESRPGWVDELLSDVEGGQIRVVVPSHFWLEVGNTLSRARTLTDDQALDGMLRLDALGLETVELDAPLRLQALRLARETSLTTYDATYLATAQVIGAPLATLDARLGAISASRGLGYPGSRDEGAVHKRVSEPTVRYGSVSSDPVSLAAIGAALAELRRQHDPT